MFNWCMCAKLWRMQLARRSKNSKPVDCRLTMPSFGTCRMESAIIQLRKSNVGATDPTPSIRQIQNYLSPVSTFSKYVLNFFPHPLPSKLKQSKRKKSGRETIKSKQTHKNKCGVKNAWSYRCTHKLSGSDERVTVSCSILFAGTDSVSCHRVSIAFTEDRQIVKWSFGVLISIGTLDV